MDNDVQAESAKALSARVRKAVNAFVEWLSTYGYESYDQYDLWANTYGKRSKASYYRWGRFAAPLVAPLILADLVTPSTVRRLFCSKRRFAIADAHFASGFVSLYRLTGESSYLDRAEVIAEHLRKTALPGFSGLCWGYPFDWQTKRGLWKQNVPFVTSTPYVFDMFVELFDATGNAAYLDDARSVATFVAEDIRHVPTQGSGKAASYTPFDDSWVINASAYRAACLSKASSLFGIESYRALAEENTQFILEQQQSDGSWFYSASDQNDQFIDHFHTCFVLKGLWRIYVETGNAAVLQGIRRGYRYYRGNLFYPDGTPRPFAAGHSARFRVSELYDYAEAINLHLLLSGVIAEAAGTASFLVNDIVRRWLTPAGHFITRRSRGGLVNRVPYHRWAQAQTFRTLVLWVLQAGSMQCAG